ncbi:MAG: flagellar protein FlaG [Bryobacteraceae bacterium]|nr:flagellar protein FlaG [Bryobacteraceae bacterium]
MEVGKIEHLAPPAAHQFPHALSPEQRAEQQQLIKAVEAVNEAQLFGESTELTFTFDRHTNKLILQLIDRETREIVRQIPPEFLLRLAEDLR